VSIGAKVPESIPVPINAAGAIENCAKISVGNQRGLEPNSAASARARSR
jgi:hypothetical protein